MACAFLVQHIDFVYQGVARIKSVQMKLHDGFYFAGACQLLQALGSCGITQTAVVVCITPRPELACLTGTAPVAPGMAMRSVAQVAGVRVFHNQINQRLATQAMRKSPCVGLVDPHQRRFN